MKLHIPQPCHEDWDQMQPEEQGRYCQVCSKTVVDFTGWELQAITDYMMQRTEERVCGRFTENQLDIPEKTEKLNWPALIDVSGLSFLKKVAAIIVVVFGLTTSSCEKKRQLTGVTVPRNMRKTVIPDDSTASGQKQVLMGYVDEEAPKCENDEMHWKLLK